MAILLVNIENEASMALNEFFDYNGHCYALSSRRKQDEGLAITFNDFYESTVATNMMEDIPVVFCEQNDDGIDIVGWYTKAKIYSKSRDISLFLRGNIVADSSDVVWLKKKKRIKDVNGSFMFRNYNVIEMEDCRYDSLASLVYVEQGEHNSYENIFVRYPYIHIDMDANARRNFDLCIKYCQMLAGNIMDDSCQGLAEIKALQMYANEAMNTNKSSADGYYYYAMACYQLGFLKDAIKAIEKAIKLEPMAADLIAQKANILVSMGHYDAAVDLYKEAKKLDGENASDYIELEERVQKIKLSNSFYNAF